MNIYLKNLMSVVDFLKTYKVVIMYIVEVLVGIAAIAGLFLSVRSDRRAQDNLKKDNDRYLDGNMPIIYLNIKSEENKKMSKSDFNQDFNINNDISVDLINGGKLPAKNIYMSYRIFDHSLDENQNRGDETLVNFEYAKIQLVEVVTGGTSEETYYEISEFEKVSEGERRFLLQDYIFKTTFIQSDTKLSINVEKYFATIFEYYYYDVFLHRKTVESVEVLGRRQITIEINIEYKDFFGNDYETKQYITLGADKSMSIGEIKIDGNFENEIKVNMIIFERSLEVTRK